MIRLSKGASPTGCHADVYLVFRGGGKHQDDPTGLGIKPSGAKFISRSHGRTFANASSVTTSTAQLGANMGQYLFCWMSLVANEGRLTETEALEELKLLYTQLQRLYERIPQRGAAILTVASLMEACRTTSLRPPPAIGAPSPLKAIQSAGAPDGLSVGSGAPGVSTPTPTPILRLDKSTNTNTTATIPNGSVTTAPGNGSIVPMPTQTRITITDEVESVPEEGHGKEYPRSIDGSDFQLDHQQLQCMCSGSGEDEYDVGPRDPGLSRSMELTGRRNNYCCCSCNCCTSTRTATSRQQQQQQQHRRNDSVINNSTSAGLLTGGAVSCNCKISGVNDKSGSGASGCPSTARHKDGTVGSGEQFHKAKQHTSELVLNCQFVDGSGEHRKQQQPQQNSQQRSHPSHHQRASSSSDCGEFSTKAFESCDNLLHQQQQQQANRSQQQRQHGKPNPHGGCTGDSHVDSQATQTVGVGGGGGGGGGVAGTLAQLTPATDEATIRSVNLEKFNKLYANNSSRIDSLKEHFLMRNALTTALQHLELENRSRNHGRGRGSAKGELQEGVGGKNETTGEGTSEGASGSTEGVGGTSGAKKKKSPEKRLVIDLNDRSKYTEEVSV
uniref:Uncharacterized protein n=1 Tax=Anopheles epiroticus TaxID=199890 RepID=A0A182PG68_9DIPT